jgi:hypothetical protein
MSWQRSSGVALSAGYEHNQFNSNFGEIVTEGRVANLVGFYGLGFYPNSRTRWVNELTCRLRAQDKSSKLGTAARLDLESSIYYYISPRLQIQGSLGASWQRHDNNVSTPFQLSRNVLTSLVSFNNSSPLYDSNLFNGFTLNHIGANAMVRLSYAIF